MEYFVGPIKRKEIKIKNSKKKPFLLRFSFLLKIHLHLYLYIYNRQTHNFTSEFRLYKFFCLSLKIKTVQLTHMNGIFPFIFIPMHAYFILKIFSHAYFYLSLLSRYRMFVSLSPTQEGII